MIQDFLSRQMTRAGCFFHLFLCMSMVCGHARLLWAAHVHLICLLFALRHSRHPGVLVWLSGDWGSSAWDGGEYKKRVILSGVCVSFSLCASIAEGCGVGGGGDGDGNGDYVGRYRANLVMAVHGFISLSATMMCEGRDEVHQWQRAMGSHCNACINAHGLYYSLSNWHM